ncbi:hypothetical protein AUJ14_02565 [Candidatus Micrarchaeota archaeon CG1_02_55_22]|nr:MAG: hypothetical protein AUJ14_02565 [Candidatus Micrarchaeota archaeon CG1_02_55_22]
MPPVKLEKKDSKPEAAAANDTIELKISVPKFAFETGPVFQMKLILLGLFVLIFAFALFMFVRADFATSDLFQINRLTENVQKLWSVSVVLFIVLYGVTLGLAMFYGQGLPRAQAALPLAVAVVIAFIASFLAGPYSPAFYAFALTAGAASLLATNAQDLKLSTIWGTTGKALTLLLVIAFLFTFLKVNASRDAYFGSLAEGMAESVPALAAEAAPQVGGQALALCATAIDQATIDENAVKKVITEDAFKTQLASASPEYTALPGATQTALAASLYPAMVMQAVTLSNAVKTDLALQLRNVDASKQVANAPPLSAGEVKTILTNLPFGRQMYAALPLGTALAIVSILTLLNFFIHIVAAGTAYGLGKFFAV